MYALLRCSIIEKKMSVSVKVHIYDLVSSIFVFHSDSSFVQTFGSEVHKFRTAKQNVELTFLKRAKCTVTALRACFFKATTALSYWMQPGYIQILTYHA